MKIQSIVLAGFALKEKQFVMRYLGKSGEEYLLTWIKESDEPAEILKSGGKIVVYSEYARQFIETSGVVVESKAILLLLKGNP